MANSLVQITEEHDQVVAEWRLPPQVGGLIVAASVLELVLFGAVIFPKYQGNPVPVILLFCVVTLLGAGLGVAMLINRTRLVATRSAISVRTKPVPLSPARDFDPSQAVGFFVVMEEGNKGGKVPHLKMRDESGQETLVGFGFGSRVVAEQVSESVNRFYRFTATSGGKP